jgi:phenylacetate-CoA ligase
MHPTLVGLLERALARRQGRRYLDDLERFADMQYWPRERLDAWRLERMRELLRHAAANVPYWRERMRELGAQPEDFRSFGDLRRLPAMTKELINSEGRRMHSEVPTGRRVTEKSTGGSTGRNIWFAIDIDTHDRRRAAGMLTELWDDVRRGTRTAILWGSPLEAKPSRASRAFDALANRKFFSVYGVDESTLESYFEQLLRFQPEVISSYPSILSHMARRLGRDRCRRLGVRVIYCSAEVLFEPTRAELEDLFGASVRNRYATREFGIVAAECPAGEGLHLMDMRFVVEIDEPEQPGGPGELVVTDLDNRSFPWIRYRIRDLAGWLPEPCSCGRSLTRLSGVDARVFDVIETPDGRMFGGSFFPILMRPSDRTVERFQVVQEEIDRLHIKLVPGPGYGSDRREKILAQLRETMGETMRVTIEEVDHIEPLPSGKHRFIVSKVRERES